ncbi:hypothetical protein PBI_SCTP2_132 [Salicola phage SCTP-2]|nr:hypothetical protein PBI_SCTP2_132 [Salicola phage SCTP-2]
MINDNNSYYNKKDIENLIKKLPGESIPVVFIDHIIVFYDNGEVKEIEQQEMQYFFPNITHTTTDMINYYEGISEINVKIDIDKMKNYMNNLRTNIMSCYNYYIDKHKKGE